MTTKPCHLCPRHCGALRPQSAVNISSLPGICSSPRNPVIARAGLHYWEEPMISGTRGSGTVFFSGCNLHCVYCQNYNISTLHQGKEVSVARLKEIYQELIAAGAHNINLVTPTHYLDAIVESLDTPLPVPVVYHSTGYESVESLRKLEGKVQIYLPDLKYADDELGKRYSAVSGYFAAATAAIEEMVRQTGPFQIDQEGIMQSGVIIRHLILPGHLKNTYHIIRYVAEHFQPGEVFFSLMSQYLPCGKVSDTQFPEINRKLSRSEYLRAEKWLLNSGIEDGFLQDRNSASNDFIPDFNGFGV